MARGLDAWGRAPWAAQEIPNQAVPGTLPPPIPGGSASVAYSVQAGSYPWALRGWAGAVAAAVYPGGGMVLTSRPDTGVVQVLAWWPDAAAVQVVRIDPDGVRRPVRGAYPATPSTPTRRNLATNPSVETGLNGYVPGTGSPTLSTISRTDLGSATEVAAWRATIAGAGTNEVTVPAGAPGQKPLTIAVDLQFSARPTSLTITVGWTDAAGGALTASVATMSADTINATVGQFSRVVGYVSPPAAAAVVSTIKIAAGGLPAGATMDGDRVLVEQDVSDGSYFDGNSLGGTWTGTTHLSTSLLAPVQTILDGECPLDLPVLYEVSNPALAGGRITSAPVTLDSGNRTWLTHPATPSAPVRCEPTAVPDMVRGTEQGVFRVLDRELPVVVSSAVRFAPSGTISFGALSWVERDALVDLFADCSPLLMRAPATYGYGLGSWLALGDITESADGRRAWQDCRIFTAPFQVTDAPAGPNSLAA